MIHKNLFTLNFRRIRFFNRLLMVISGAIVLLFIFHILNYMYVEESEWSRKLWHDYYETESIDNIFVGSSHVYCSVNPNMLDSINGMENYNISVSSMRMNGVYYAIREVADDHALKNVYVEVYYGVLAGEDGDCLGAYSTMKNWYLYDYLEPSCNKIFFLCSMRKSDKLLDTVFPFIRYREHIFDASYIKSNLKNKATDDYKNYKVRAEYDTYMVEYQDKGYLYDTNEMSEYDLLYGQEVNLQSEGLMPYNTDSYLRKTIEYCQEKGINIVLYVSPLYASQVLSAIDYDLYNQQVLSIANDYGIPFYDFNLCKSEYLDITHKEYYKNAGHLNSRGADLFTPFLWEVLSGNYEENQKFFCQTYEEKIHLDMPETYGVYYYDNGEDGINFTVASNRETEMEYRIVFTPYEGEQRIIQDFSENKDFVLSYDECGTLAVVSRIKAQPQQMQSLEMECNITK